MARILFTPALFVALSIAGCSAGETASAPASVAWGRILVIGNEPFTSLALETDSGKVYVLHCDPATRNILLRRQGERVKISYKETEPVPEGLALRVLTAEPLAPQ